jgi:hypothetical protein
MEAIVYILCTGTALACSLLLLRGYRRTGVRLLLWTGLCFLLLGLENGLLFVDRILLPPKVDLTFWRAPIALAAVVLLLFGLIWQKR